MIDLHEGVLEIFCEAQHCVVRTIAFPVPKEEKPNLQLAKVDIRMTIGRARVLCALRDEPRLSRALRLAGVSVATRSRRKLVVDFCVSGLAHARRGPQRSGLNAGYVLEITELGRNVAEAWLKGASLT